ncbi:MarR family winged helix-turn-helix transcriptional regulator [Glaciihabitans sp. dw_435]|uniref:MarR family winged helix-turn-helix transcriptional regulator n=1 Tax=Glaciihabitans sp. dw_435 TaxID=2720081 RepID=UPI001BD3E9AF|nr:MarR family transcriptional regulator [Glaciihabitans sp. dw_435]
MTDVDGTESWPTGRLLSTAARLVEHAWVEALAEMGLTHAGLIALHLLDAGPLNQTDLAQRARVQTQTMSRTIDRLERQGFVERRPDDKDRRRQLVSRTESGADAWRKTRTLEADLFPATDDPAGLRAALLAIISSTSGARWSNAD